MSLPCSVSSPSTRGLCCTSWQLRPSRTDDNVVARTACAGSSHCSSLDSGAPRLRDASTATLVTDIAFGAYSPVPSLSRTAVWRASPSTTTARPPTADTRRRRKRAPLFRAPCYQPYGKLPFASAAAGAASCCRTGTASAGQLRVHTAPHRGHVPAFRLCGWRCAAHGWLAVSQSGEDEDRRCAGCMGHRHSLAAPNRSPR